MARKPSVFVRALSMDEGRKIQRITRTAKDPVRLRRATVVMMSGQGQAVPDIVSLMQVSDDYVRDVIHAFNERGFDALDPKWSAGRPRRIGEQIREWICLIARTSPADLGQAGFSTWSLAKLRDYLLAEGIVAEISPKRARPWSPSPKRDHHRTTSIADGIVRGMDTRHRSQASWSSLTVTCASVLRATGCAANS